MTKFGTMKMTPEFMKEMDDMEKAHNPEYKGRHTHISVTTDGSDVSREEIEAEVRRWVQDRIDGKCKVMTSFPKELKTKKNFEDFLISCGSSAKETKKVFRGCPNKGNLCGCLGGCQDVISVPLNDPRQAIEEYPL